MKGKSAKGNCSLKSKLGLPALIFVLCLFCFFAGFFGSSLLSQVDLCASSFLSILDFVALISATVLISQFFPYYRMDKQDVDDDRPRPRPRLLHSVSDGSEYDLMPSGEDGEDSISSIPFQVLSVRL